MCMMRESYHELSIELHSQKRRQRIICSEPHNLLLPFELVPIVLLPAKIWVERRNRDAVLQARQT